jgi:hypothetical protein
MEKNQKRQIEENCEENLANRRNNLGRRSQELHPK